MTVHLKDKECYAEECMIRVEIAFRSKNVWLSKKWNIDV